jgi:hypothetical protein
MLLRRLAPLLGTFAFFAAQSASALTHADLKDPSLTPTDLDAIASVVKIYPTAAPSGTPGAPKGMTCTATIIRKNILLTAGHCAISFPEGGRLSINDADHFTVEKTRILSGSMSSESDPHDIALLLIKPDADFKKTLRDHRLPVAKTPSDQATSKDVLVAGYGSRDLNITRAWPKDLTLQAAHITFAKSDFGLATPVKYAEKIEFTYPQVAVGMAVYQLVTTFMPGTFTPVAQNQTIYFPEAPMTVATEGDSGSPAISYRADGKPEIVGVLSVVANQNLNAISIVDIKLAGGSTSLFRKAMPNVTSEIVSAKLLDLGLVDAKGMPTQAFKIASMRLQTLLSEYSSVYDPKNAEFIQNSLRDFGSK